MADGADACAPMPCQAAKRWPTWGCGAEKFPWSYTDSETCYVLEGRVIVTPDGAPGAGARGLAAPAKQRCSGRGPRPPSWVLSGAQAHSRSNA